MKIKITTKSLIALGMTILFAILLYITLGYGEMTRRVPLVVIVPGLIVSAIQFVRDIREAPAKEKPAEAKDQPAESETVVPGEGTLKEKLTPQEKRRREWIAIGWLFLFFAMIAILGLSISIPLFILLLMKIYGRESWRLSISVAVLMWAFIYVTFVWGMRSDLYP